MRERVRQRASGEKECGDRVHYQKMSDEGMSGVS